MSLQLIQNYYNEIERAKKFGGSKNETSIRTPFLNLVNSLARPKNLELVPEISIKSSIGTVVRPDGVLRDILQFDYGFWESKDQKDDIFEEIEEKFRKGYPKNNILFEDTQTAILFQEGKKIQIDMQNAADLLDLLNQFINYERPEVKEFKTAIAKFSEDLPTILDSLRNMIGVELANNTDFSQKINLFLQLCQNSINPILSQKDVWEMLIQHILTEEIFMSIFDNVDYHRENNIAQSLYEVEKTFFRGKTKQDILHSIRPYYKIVKSRANEMISHWEKQKFLKTIYENFYRAYNPKGADRLGIVYTPNEIVKFMIEGTEFLLERHFSKTLGSPNVEILDPCTGTGTFVTELIEHIPSHQLAHKFENEIHANEMALLPYYVANLNIEAVFQQKMGTYQEFKNLCFVDTLDNTDALQYSGKQNALFGSLSMENVERIKRQNEKKISVIIGNPPYNANQQNENDNNKNREYADIDKRIKETYIKESTAQKTKVYDMYARFFRWAMDRMNQNGIVAFVTNRSFVDSRTFDGFRKIAQKDFQEIWILDTKSDVRANPKIAGTTHNVFGIQTGVCIAFFVKNEKIRKEKCKIYYYSLKDEQKKEEKLNFLLYNHLKDIDFDRIFPDKNGTWINQSENDFEDLLKLCSKDAKLGKGNETIFELFTSQVKTNRDEWVFDISKENLTKKVKFFIEKYNFQVKSKLHSNEDLDYSIKWSSTLKEHLKRKNKLVFAKKWLICIPSRPYTRRFLYSDKKLNDRLTQNHYLIAGENLALENLMINISGVGMLKPFQCLMTNQVADYSILEATQCLPLYRYEKGEKKENITHWALEEFRKNYQNPKIQKIDIFHYVYAVLHCPEYRQKYEQNLKRDFPRIPLYEDFWKWAKLGKALMDLHLNYEQAEAYGLERHDKTLKNPDAKASTKLKANKETGEIYIDENTTLKGIPKIAWDYKLGNRSALEWILDQYKENKPSDLIILEKFNNYKFSDYKEEVIELLQRVCTVSVRTMEIIEKM